MSSLPSWIILQIKSNKTIDSNQSGKQIFYEMCDSKGNKIGSAITIPTDSKEDLDFKSIILTKVPPGEVLQLLKEAGIEAYVV